MQFMLRFGTSAHRLHSQQPVLPWKQIYSVPPRTSYRKSRLIAAHGQAPQEPKPTRNDEDHRRLTSAILRSAAATWSRLDTPQRLYTVVAAGAVLLAAPQLLTLLLISAERLLVGALLVVEEVLGGALLAGTRLIALSGVLALVAVQVVQYEHLGAHKR
ncbi:hypothetical protein VOLCADRAFT_104572 [Volvox carteri f. nagariensis]|uniref:Uncharacterized protein n=1 Tax=Volvox carteri f. nagariensis TaxID=3068 RepID=D8TUI7_VOLCA|nr:uncharacterized protein VOLCADRAFT_104572 [Volvox carteri f. nagariensis]EFJ48830.1 hypothetical protein VOLCADRAFT_104572 [Volvox carteri f. nagariensis]|eukprot:XP_002950162.1 hypothetical protein VOLCADRAFT_104572 [Volvox carteri f. nagariensis]